MTIDEAKKIAEIVSTADGGCIECVDDLCAQLREAFPQFVWKPIRLGEIQVVEVKEEKN